MWANLKLPFRCPNFIVFGFFLVLFSSFVLLVQTQQQQAIYTRKHNINKQKYI